MATETRMPPYKILQDCPMEQGLLWPFPGDDPNDLRAALEYGRLLYANGVGKVVIRDALDREIFWIP
jgi:hypothetical protein